MKRPVEIVTALDFGARLTSAGAERLKRLLLRFPADEEGRLFAASTGVQNIRTSSAAAVKVLDAVVDETRVLLGATGH